MDPIKAVQLLLLTLLSTANNGQPLPGSSYSSSLAISGKPPYVYTYQSGSGVAASYAGATQPSGTYTYITSVSRPRRELAPRNDANQQRTQNSPPPGFAPPDYRQAPGSEVIIREIPPPFITFSNSRLSRELRDDDIVEMLSQDVSQRVPRVSRKGTPAKLYGPPSEYDEDQNNSGGGISSDALGNIFRKPHAVYGPPGVNYLSFNTPDDSTSNDQISGQYIFIPAFPETEAVVDNIPFAPAPPGGFEPADGALLAPPAPVINNLPLPSPRRPEKSKLYFKLYPRLT